MISCRFFRLRLHLKKLGLIPKTRHLPYEQF
jgi:hypothetical protein